MILEKEVLTLVDFLTEFEESGVLEDFLLQAGVMRAEEAEQILGIHDKREDAFAGEFVEVCCDGFRDADEDRMFDAAVDYLAAMSA